MDNFFFGKNKFSKSESNQEFTEISSNYSRTYSKGKSFKFSIWNEVDTYNNDEFVQDFVQWNQKLWAAKKTSTNIPPTQGEYWELIVEGVSDVEFKQEDNRILWKYEDDLEWKDLFELDSVSEDQIKKMLEDLDIKYRNTYDDTLSLTSTNAVQNQAVTKKFKELDDKNTRTDNELTNIKSSVNTALSNSKSYTDSKISETKIQIDSELNKKANQTNIDETVDELNKSINLKVDKVFGKGLSTNDFNDNYKSKLDNLDSSLNSALTSAKSHTNSEITKVDNKIKSEISRAQASETNLSNRINNLGEDVIKSLNEAKEYTDALANGEVKNNTNKINILNGTGEGSVIKTVKDEISNLVGTAPEKLDTLQEIADYLEEHEDMASGLVNSLSELETKKADKTALNNLKTETDSALQSLEKSKANTTGYYPQLSVGQADNLPDRGDVTEGLIGFRESAGAGNSIEDGTANVVELLGESLVWNQKFDAAKGLSSTPNGITYTQDGFVFMANGTANSTSVSHNIVNVKLDASHKYIVPVKTSDGVYVQVYDSSNARAYDSIFTAAHSAAAIMRLRVAAGTTLTNYKFTLYLIDLTQMFGAGKEPTTIEEFEAIKNQLVGVDFNAYNEGEVLSVNIKGIKSVNDNAWDEEWENGTFNITTGEDIDGSWVMHQIRSKNLIPILPNEEYYVSMGKSEMWLIFLDKAENLIESPAYSGTKVGNSINIKPNSKFRTPINAAFARFYCIGNYGNTYNHDICIRLAHSGYKTDYVAHEEAESSFDLTPYFPNGMYGINDVRDSVTKSKATRRIGVVDMGTLEWTHDATNYRFYTNELISFIKKPSSGWGKNLLCAKYDSIIWDSTLDKFVTVLSSGRIYVKDSSYADAATFKEEMQGVMLYYELATPIETEIDPQLNMNYKVWDFGTEELLTDSKSTPVLARTIYGFNATDTIRGNKAKNEEQDERLRTLESEVVRKDDYQPDLSVGLADNLAGVDVVDSEVNFRRSGGGAISDGVARIEAIKGNSMVWNQLYPTGWSVTREGITITSQNNIITANGTLTATYFGHERFVENEVNHKYLFIVEGLSSALNGAIFSLQNRLGNEATVSNGFAYFFHDNSDPSLGRNIGFSRLTSGTVISETYIFRQIDLTKMFGAGNEPTTIEEFYARKPMGIDEYAYNEGEVIHMDVQSIESQGVNAWDEELENGKWNDALEQWESNTVSLKSKNYIQILPNAQYRITNPSGTISRYVFYDKDKQYLSYVSASSNSVFTTPNNAFYMMFGLGSAYKLPYNHDICINISDTSINGKYFPYIKRVEDLSIIRKYFPQGMKSAGSAHDEIRYNKATQKWEKVQRIGSVDLGNYAFYKDSTRDFFKIVVNGMLVKPNYVCAKYDNIKYAELGSAKGIFLGIESTRCIISISDPSYGDDSQKFRQDIQGVMLYYELAEPIVTELDAEDQFKDLDYQVWNCGTEKAIAEGKSAPLAADITYGFNAIGKIKELESLVAALRAKVGI